MHIHTHSSLLFYQRLRFLHPTHPFLREKKILIPIPSSFYQDDVLKKEMGGKKEIRTIKNFDRNNCSVPTFVLSNEDLLQSDSRQFLLKTFEIF
uniref:Uncharacterized protein n=1 Tax=Caenorhabditis tropicalis TaxID=1561998 RepID=A0A1I7U3C6_9PELO